jgi:hypothetical protein
VEKRTIIRVSLILVVLLLGAWALSSAAGVGPDTVARQQAVRSAMAPAGVIPSGTSDGSVIEYGPITPSVVNLADVPVGVPSKGGATYEQWLNGDIDLEEEYRVSAIEVAALRDAAMKAPPNANIQKAELGGGPALLDSFDSLDVTECCGGSGTVVPPDPEMAAGPNHLIAVVNLAFEVYDKSGNSLAGPTTYDSFFANVPECGGGFDPTVVYDEEADRFVLGIDADGTHYCAAVTATSDPTGAWYIYAVPAQPFGGEFHDYPHTGVGDEYIVVGANQFGGAVPNGFEGRVWALDKGDMYAGGAMTPITASTTDLYGTPQPLHLHGFAQGTWPAYGNTHYFTTDLYDGCSVQIWEWNIPAAPTITGNLDLCTATGVTGLMPVPAPQSGGETIEGNDWRMRGFEYRNGSGWIADSIGCNPGAGTVNCARWVQVDLSGVPSVAQAGVYASDGEYRIFPDLAVNHCDDMAIGYTKTNGQMFPGIWYTGRQAGDPAGTLQGESELKAGEVTYFSFDGAPLRWGDYTGMTIDPDGVTFWYLGEYAKDVPAGPAANWGNYIGSFAYECDAQGEPDLVLTKTVSTDGTCGMTSAITTTWGTDVTYCYSVENMGTVTATTHTLTDTVLGTLLTDVPYDLGPGDTFVYTTTVTMAAPPPPYPSDVTNCAIWTGMDAAGAPYQSNEACATVTLQAPTDVSLSGFAGETGRALWPMMLVVALVGVGAAFVLRRRAWQR